MEWVDRLLTATSTFTALYALWLLHKEPPYKGKHRKKKPRKGRKP